MEWPPDISGPNGRRLLEREQVESLLTNRFRQFRFQNWEDDISFNSVDDQPFENLPPVSEFREELERMKREKISVEEIISYASKDLAPLPCPADRENYSVNHHGRYWFTGLSDYLSVMSVAAKHDVDVQRYFDFGCASGRVLRHFVAQSKVPELWGSDINARHVRWLCEFMPKRVKPIANHAIPKLPIPDHNFDLITAFSVFTHIDTFETCWLAELKRILKPGGIAYLTIHNEDTWKLLRSELDNPANRLIESMESVDPGIKEKLLVEMPVGKSVFRFSHKGPYRANVFHSNSYIENVWGRFFDVVEILPCHHVRQSVVILR